MKALAEQISDIDGVNIYGRVVGVRGLTAAPASTQTIWQAITAGIKNDTVPKDVALEAFSYQYKVSIPGVTVPGGVCGPRPYPSVVAAPSGRESP